MSYIAGEEFYDRLDEVKDLLARARKSGNRAFAEAAAALDYTVATLVRANTATRRSLQLLRQTTGVLRKAMPAGGPHNTEVVTKAIKRIVAVSARRDLNRAAS